MNVVTKFDELAAQASNITIKNIANALNGKEPIQDDDAFEFLRKNTDSYADVYVEEFRKQLQLLAKQDLQKQIGN